MLKKLLSFLFLLVMTVGIYAQSIPSGEARYQALGYNPFIMDAATDINRNPAWAGLYRNYSFGDIGTADGVSDDFELANQYAGVNFGVGKKITLGIVLNKDESMWSSFTNDPGNLLDTIYNPTNLGIKAPVVPLKLLFSWSNKKLNLGLAPYFAMWSKENYSGATNDNKYSSLSLGGTIGIISHMKNNSWIEGDVDVKINKYKWQNIMTTTTTYDNTGGLELSATVRGWFLANKRSKINIVPYVNFSMFNYTAEVVGITVPSPDIKNLSIMGGVGVNMPILDNGMLAGGLSSGISSYKFTKNDASGLIYKFNTFTIPQFNIGTEWKLVDWLIGRIGYSRSVMSIKYEQTTSSPSLDSYYTEWTPSNPDQTITMGLGFEFSRFSIDGLIGEKFFQRAPYLISGHPTDMFGVLSASYNFNK